MIWMWNGCVSRELGFWSVVLGVMGKKVTAEQPQPKAGKVLKSRYFGYSYFTRNTSSQVHTCRGSPFISLLWIRMKSGSKKSQPMCTRGSKHDIGQITSLNSSITACSQDAWFYLFFLHTSSSILHGVFWPNCIRKRKRIPFILRGLKRATAPTCPGGRKRQDGGLTRAQPFAQLKANRLMGFKSLLPKHSFSFPKQCWLPGTGSCVCPRHAVKDVHF